MDYFSSNFKLGILGGGQLVKMFSVKLENLIYTPAFDPSNEAPCKISANEMYKETRWIMKRFIILERW